MATDSLVKSAGVGRIGAILAAIALLSMTQINGIIASIIAFLKACGVDVSPDMQSSIIGLFENFLPIYILLVSGRSKLAEAKKAPAEKQEVPEKGE